MVVLFLSFRGFRSFDCPLVFACLVPLSLLECSRSSHDFLGSYLLIAPFPVGERVLVQPNFEHPVISYPVVEQLAMVGQLRQSPASEGYSATRLYMQVRLYLSFYSN